jgi:hypothetical protein
MAFMDVLNKNNYINGIPFERVVEGETIDDSIINRNNYINGIPFQRVVHERKIHAGAVFVTNHIDRK